MGFKVLDRRLELMRVLLDVELDLLNELLCEKLDKGFQAEDSLIAMELEVMTKPEDVKLLTYFNVEDEDHSEPDRVKFQLMLSGGELVQVEIKMDWISAGVMCNRNSYWYLADNTYFALDPAAAWEIIDNHKENWEGSQR